MSGNINEAGINKPQVKEKKKQKPHNITPKENTAPMRRKITLAFFALSAFRKYLLEKKTQVHIKRHQSDKGDSNRK